MTEQIDSLTEVVYSAEMAPPKTPPQDPRFDSFASDIKELKQNIEGIRGDFKSLNPMVVRIDERTSNFWTFGGIVAGFLVVWLGIISRQVFLAPPTLSTIATSPVNQRVIDQTKKVLAESRAAGRPGLPPDFIRGVGQNMIQVAAAGKDTQLANSAWSETNELMSYRSVLNVDLAPLETRGVPRIIHDFLFHFTVRTTSGAPMVNDDVIKQVRTFGEDVPLVDAARFELIGSTVNSSRPLGPRIIQIELPPGYSLVLDGHWIKNTVIRNLKVVYHGGPIALENVYFIDCTFEMDNLPPARNIAERILTNTAVSFDGTIV
jgi:hypothetical protein